MTNDETLEDKIIRQDFRPVELTFLVLISLAQSVLGCIGNVISIVTIAFTRRLNEIPSNLLILNLAVSDLLTCVVFLPFHIHNLLLTSLDETQRFYYHAVCLFHVFSNGNAILVITIDRFVGVSFPLRYGTLVTKRRAFQAIFMSWIMPVSFSAAFFTSLQKDSPESSEFALRVYMIVSVVVVLVLYIMIYVAARKQRQKIRAVTGMSNISDNAKTFMIGIAVWKSTINTFFLVVFYVLTYLPILCYDFRFSLNKEPKYTEVSERVYAWVLSLQFINSCVDPFLYVFRCRHFKVAFFKLFQKALLRLRK